MAKLFVPLSPVATSPKVIFPLETATAGQEIQKLRQAHGLSLYRLAYLAGVSASSLSRWEAQKRVPSMPELEAVLSALEATEAQKRAILRLIHAPRAVLQLRTLGGMGSISYANHGGGDLLWAMRQRRGWTQSETARAAHVLQSEVARWESGDTWPGTKDLHALCWCLNAQPEEVAALTCWCTGDGNLYGGDGEGSPVLRGETASGWDAAGWSGYVIGLLHHPPPEELFDLTLIAAEQQLSRLLPSHDFAVTLLPDMYAIHARHHLHRGQGSQAAHWAERGLALVRRQQFSGFTLSADRLLWFGNVLVLAAAAGQSKRRAGLRRAAEFLRTWLPAAQQRRDGNGPYKDETANASAASHYAWGQMTQAGYLNQLGRTREAISLGQTACREAEQIRPSEGFLRRRDFAQLLVNANQPAEALHVLDENEALLLAGEIYPDTLARHRLAETECYSALNDARSAQESARTAEQIIGESNLWYLLPDLRRLTAAF